MPGKEVAILRIGHRPERDQRVTTHVGLTARALGGKGMYLAASDKGVVKSIADVAGRWGGEFFCEDNVKWRSCIKTWKAEGGVVVHLTMYGINLPDAIGEIRMHGKILVIVGAEKVPGDIYGLADYNVAVTGQPHSEISSLALFLDHLFEGSELRHEFPGAQIRIVPSKAGKQTEGP
ncbi:MULTISPECIES: tRNA (cytidine(56)-2'-O)-methyltransferase [unclassified Methanoregula]|uniref:tRNA (cytidine(56)-2'-O)-methyltransferase n=1 Tax=unclassified Methanoregula TaxID=2649730 RepID=UPI0009C82CA4|nr:MULTISPECIES: tRNA (cytidine(56)-2'-O)-methyltransferase [unclassified Methanoregula]OPX65248.1 MAG: tRNA (cytidine(56)-2'-O)-methyltransferase [Methanoregula sp. PtaB.Bin085]OPY32157.1 MAG: tRNA (cytidine(56)-2'-O)-methyltransferase [Methanoregula sp. PtaU1.Bin006]